MLFLLISMACQMIIDCHAFKTQQLCPQERVGGITVEANDDQFHGNNSPSYMPLRQ